MNEQFFRSSDLSLVAVISLYYPIEEIDWQEAPKANFVFIRDEKLDRLIDSYWRGDLRIEPKEYFNQLKVIKSRIYGK